MKRFLTGSNHSTANTVSAWRVGRSTTGNPPMRGSAQSQAGCPRLPLSTWRRTAPSGLPSRIMPRWPCATNTQTIEPHTQKNLSGPHPGVSASQIAGNNCGGVKSSWWGLRLSPAAWLDWQGADRGDRSLLAWTCVGGGTQLWGVEVLRVLGRAAPSWRTLPSGRGSLGMNTVGRLAGNARVIPHWSSPTTAVSCRGSVHLNHHPLLCTR
jgi:hypothetical protein